MRTPDFAPPIAVYIAAHQDDWQLFRGNWAWNDVQSGAKVVFIYVTAGDGGQGEKQWKAREAAAMASVEMITGQPAAPPTQENFNGRPITCYVSALTRSYFLRLPDGGFCEPGKGYERTGFQSLTLLRNEGKRMEAVDCSASYESWYELIDTVSAILTRETETSSNTTPWINTSRKDRQANPDDHFDHYEVGEIVEAFAPGRENVVGWAGYTNRTKPVEHPELEKKRALMRAYRAVMKDRLEDFDVVATEKHDECFMNFEGE
jgi:GlcNAc-PI de-N-acetylase